MLTSDAEVLWTARYDYRPDWKLARHEHDYFQMIYFLAGTGRLLLGDREHPIQAGDLCLIRPNTVHGFIPESLVKTLDLKFSVKPGSFREALTKAVDVITEKGSGIAGIFEHIRWEGEHTDYLYREICNVFLCQILIHYLRQDRTRAVAEVSDLEDGNEPADELVRATVSFIEQHYAEDLTLGQIARAVKRSDRHIRQHFEEVLGVSPMRFLQRYRVQKSKELIQYSDYGLKKVAELAGFKTIHHFGRVFRDITGEAPGAWRKKYHEGICKDVCIDPQFSNTNWTIQGARRLDPSVNQAALI